MDLHNNCLSALSGSLAVLCGLFFPLCLCHLSFPGRQGLGSQGDTLLCQYRRILENSYILMLFYHLQKIYQCYQREERRSNMDFISYYSLHLCCLDKQIFLFCLFVVLFLLLLFILFFNFLYLFGLFLLWLWLTVSCFFVDHFFIFFWPKTLLLLLLLLLSYICDILSWLFKFFCQVLVAVFSSLQYFLYFCQLLFFYLYYSFVLYVSFNILWQKTYLFVLYLLR